jgi:hypothetical protein
MAEMQSWMRNEEERNTIEFVRKEKRPNQASTQLWNEKDIYICARNFSGGKNNYTKKFSWTRKIPMKRIGCSCRLIVKTYPDTDEVLGHYTSEHSHEIGSKNARFTRLEKETREEIEQMLRLGVEPKKVVCSNMPFILKLNTDIFVG